MKPKRLRWVVVTCFCLVIALGSVGHMTLGQSEKCSPAPPIVQRLVGHTNGAVSLAFSPDGKYLASGSGDHLVKLWDVRTGREIWSVEAHGWYGVTVVEFSPDGSLLASGGMLGRIKLWDSATGKQLREFPKYMSQVTSIAFMPDGKAIATNAYGDYALANSEGSIVVLDIDTGELRSVFQSSDGRLVSVVCSPDGEFLAASGYGCITFFDASSGQELISLPGRSRQSANRLWFSPNGQFLVGRMALGSLLIWDATTWHPPYSHRGVFRDVAFTPDGRSFVTGRGQDDPAEWLVFWDLATGRRICDIDCEKKVASVALSPDGNLLASGCFGGEILIWDVSQLVLGEEPPIALNDTAFTLEDTPVTVDVTMNDSDPNENLDPNTVTITISPVSGTTKVDPTTGAVTYTPNPDFSGTDTFTYTVCDTHGACDEATCTVDVAAVAPEDDTSAILPDENLARVIRNALGKRPEETICEADLGSLTELVAIAEGIVDLTGLEYAVNLTNLDLYGNEITDISVLAELPNLTRIDLEGNPLDPSPDSEAMEVIRALLDRGIEVDY